jgi:2-C-methyl-D-erythritol 4-phosphate cytidylyltransferase
MTVAAILVAAGDGRRLGADVPKAFVRIAGRTLLEHAVERFAGHEDVRDVVAVVPAQLLESAESLVQAGTVVSGGATRQESVDRGLAVLADDVDLVLVHDVARPFVPADVISRVVAELQRGAAAVIPALHVTDTIKRVDPNDTVTETLDRAALRTVQTPQGFRRSVLVAAHAASDGSDSPDDASLVEAAGVAVRVVEGADESFKITRAWDLRLAEAIVP